MSSTVLSWNILWHCPSLGLEWKVTFSSPVVTAEFFQICWHTECSTSTASSFRILNGSPRIPSPQLALFIVMLPRAHLTSHSRMSVTTPLWLSGSLRPFFGYSSMYFCWSGEVYLELAVFKSEGGGGGGGKGGEEGEEKSVLIPFFCILQFETH